jgi:hypothetical protein
MAIHAYHPVAAYRAAKAIMLISGNEDTKSGMVCVLLGHYEHSDFNSVANFRQCRGCLVLISPRF